MELTSEEKRANARVIMEQLGGQRFIAMTGAKNLCFDAKGITFKIGRNAGKCNYVRVEIDFGKDLYNMEFIRIHGTKMTTVKEFKGLYCDMLAYTFREVTGMATSLGF